MLLAGLGLFTGFSLLGGLAQDGAWLITARALQGASGAVLAPATLSLLTTSFRDPAGRRRALGAWSATAASGAAIGVLAGGILTDLLDWRWVLFVNVPIGIALLAAAAWAVPESRIAGTARRLDVPGALDSDRRAGRRRVWNREHAHPPVGFSPDDLRPGGRRRLARGVRRYRGPAGRPPPGAARDIPPPVAHRRQRGVAHIRGLDPQRVLLLVDVPAAGQPLHSAAGRAGIPAPWPVDPRRGAGSRQAGGQARGAPPAGDRAAARGRGPGMDDPADAR